MEHYQKNIKEVLKNLNTSRPKTKNKWKKQNRRHKKTIKIKKILKSI